MNRLKGHITHIEVSGSLSLVAVSLHPKLEIKTIIIETPDTAPYLKVGNAVDILFKETEVVIGTGSDHAISLQNQMAGKVMQIEEGKLISSLRIQTDVGIVESVISTHSVHNLKLKIGTEVVAMVKLNEVMLSA